MQLLVNGERREVQDGLTLQALVSSLQASPRSRGFAVAVDGEVVPHGHWDSTALSDGARVEIVVAVQGG